MLFCSHNQLVTHKIFEYTDRETLRQLSAEYKWIKNMTENVMSIKFVYDETSGKYLYVSPGETVLKVRADDDVARKPFDEIPKKIFIVGNDRIRWAHESDSTFPIFRIKVPENIKHDGLKKYAYILYPRMNISIVYHYYNDEIIYMHVLTTGECELVLHILEHTYVNPSKDISCLSPVAINLFAHQVYMNNKCDNNDISIVYIYEIYEKIEYENL